MLRLNCINRVAASVALLNKGKVVSWINGRGFGFVEDDADKKQHFVHFSALQVETGGYRSLEQGQEVEFDVTTVDGRTQAENVTGPGGAKLPSGPRPPEGFGGRGGGGRGGRGGRGGGRGGFGYRDRDGGRDGGRGRNDRGGQDSYSDDF